MEETKNQTCCDKSDCHVLHEHYIDQFRAIIKHMNKNPILCSNAEAGLVMTVAHEAISNMFLSRLNNPSSAEIRKLQEAELRLVPPELCNKLDLVFEAYLRGAEIKVVGSEVKNESPKV